MTGILKDHTAHLRAFLMMQIWKQIAKIYVQDSLLRGRDIRERTDKQMSRDTVFILKSHLLRVKASTVSDSGETSLVTD